MFDAADIILDKMLEVRALQLVVQAARFIENSVIKLSEEEIDIRRNFELGPGDFIF